IMANQAGTFFEMALGASPQGRRATEAKIGLSEAHGERTRQVIRKTAEDDASSKAFSTEFVDIARRHQAERGTQSGAGLSNVQSVPDGLTIDGAAADDNWRPLFDNPKALEEIAMSAARHRQTGVSEWLNMSYKMRQSGVADGLERLVLGDIPGAMAATQRAGMQTKEISPVLGGDGKESGRYLIRMADGRSMEVDPEDMRANLKSPKRFIDRAREQAAEKRKEAESGALIESRRASADASRSTAEYNRDARSELARARAEAAKTTANAKAAKAAGTDVPEGFDRKDLPIEKEINDEVTKMHGARKVDNSGVSHLTPTEDSIDRSNTVSGLRRSNSMTPTEAIRIAGGPKGDDGVHTVLMNPAQPLSAMKSGKTIVVDYPTGDGKPKMRLVILPRGRVSRGDGARGEVPGAREDIQG
ncbi:MAG: hypothetical protein ACREIB_06680, partial [Pseudomonadota bacterium]